MIITRTPFRMSFFGGGTDIASFYEIHGGAVLSTTIDKYCYVNIRHLPRFFDYRTHLTYAKTECVSSYGDIEHPLIKNCMRYLDIHDLRLMYDADLPARTGLGTSSSFAVGMLNAFYALKGKRSDKRRLADDAIYVERVLCNEAGGVQDQIAASYGGLNRIEIDSSGYSVYPVVISNERRQELMDNLALFFTGFTRLSSEVQQNAAKDMREKISALEEMKSLVYAAEDILTSKKSLNEFGELLDHAWRLKRGLSNGISSDSIDGIYERAKRAGALGGKLLGAGGGGFLLFYVEKEKRSRLCEELSSLLQVPFQFEEDGSRVIYYKAEDYDLKEYDGSDF